VGMVVVIVTTMAGVAVATMAIAMMAKEAVLVGMATVANEAAALMAVVNVARAVSIRVVGRSEVAA